MERPASSVPALSRASFEFTTSADAAVDARNLLGQRANRFDLVLDVAAIVGGLVLIALGQVAIGLFLVLAAIAFRVLTRKVQKLVIARQARSLLGRRTQVTVDDEAVRFAGELGSTEVPWSSLTDVRSDDRTVIFVRDRLLAGYLPATAFASPEEQATFVRAAAGRVSRRLADHEVRKG
jgi:hypothetical protein